MEREKFINGLNPYTFIIIFYCVGIIGHSIPYVRPYMFSITPVSLLTAGSVVIIVLYINRLYRELLFLTAVAIITFLAEAAGVNSGYIFGSYYYGPVLGPKLAGVPVIIAFNWMTVLAGGLALAQLITNNKVLFIITATLVPVLFDYILEPVAIWFGYWTWNGGLVPVSNYISWGVLSFLFASLYVLLHLSLRIKLAAFYLIMQTVFFIIMRSLLWINTM